VKCDEGRPNCARCINTGRKCDGYVLPPPGAYSWTQLLDSALPPPSSHILSPAEQRSLSFFQRVAAPSLGPQLDDYFWTRLVLQLSNHDVAVKHAVLSIGSLYEGFDRCLKSSNAVTASNGFNMWHYNEAIKHLRKTQDLDSMLFVCILFICIESLRGNWEAAINHCRHGINIINDARVRSNFTREYLEPIFWRLSFAPYFFGVRPDTFPCLLGHLPSIYRPFQSVSEAQLSLSPIAVHALRLVRAADTSGLPDPAEHRAALLDQQMKVGTALGRWFASFHLFKLHKDLNHGKSRALCHVEMLWLVVKIWVDTCLHSSESAFDKHIDKFRMIVQLGEWAAAASNGHNSSLDGCNRPLGFAAEMGFGPLLAFVMLKCRLLSLRIAAMRLMRLLSRSRESLWDYGMLLAQGRRAIEIEHKLDSGCNLDDLASHEVKESDMDRIRDFSMEPIPIAMVDGEDEPRIAHRISFLIEDTTGGSKGLLPRVEWLDLGRQ
jgi:hypothetical protein